jgi:SAM-dependent methyltransferase
MARNISAASGGEVAERERRFHDEWAAQIDPVEVPVVASFEGSTSPEARWIVKQLGSVKGKRILELGSGAGEGAVYFARLGADVTATDISPDMLDVVKAVARHHGVELRTQLCAATDLSALPGEHFDVVYAANLLHHVEIEKCLEEVLRVLKPGGFAAFWDPIAHNPVINVYRRMAAAVRTEDEHPLRRSDLALVRRRFSEVRVEFFWLSALIVFLKFYLVDRIHPSSGRYWKLIIHRERELKSLVEPLFGLDRLLLNLLPPLKWWCWNLAIVARK